MPPSDVMLAKFVSRSRKRKPPRRIYAPAVVPGYGDYVKTKAAITVGQRHPNDGASTPRSGAQRAPYRKGERFKRKNPYKYQRGDAARARRPRYD
jgi:hypothetical protein